MRILLDTNIVLDVLLKREPFWKDSAALWHANERGLLECYISVITPINIFYIARKIKGQDAARQAVEEILGVFQVCPLDLTGLQIALKLPLKDYEDAVQVASAVTGTLDGIATRDREGYVNAPIPVFSPGEIIGKLPGSL